MTVLVVFPLVGIRAADVLSDNSLRKEERFLQRDRSIRTSVENTFIHVHTQTPTTDTAICSVVNEATAA